MRFLRFPRSAGSSDEPRRPGRWRRWVLRSLACLAGLIAFVALAVIVVVHSLDRPWLKRRVQGLARTSAGVEIDYRTARIELFSGAQIEDIVVQSPAEVHPFAPDLARVGRIDAGWSLGALLLGH